MRKVLFKRWIPTGWEEIEGKKLRKDNTSCWEAGIPKSSNIKGIPMIFGTGCEQQIGG